MPPNKTGRTSSRTSTGPLFAFCLLLLGSATYAGDSSLLSTGAKTAEGAYQKAKKAFDAEPSANAEEFAHRTFDWAEFSRSDTERARLAEEGISAARGAIRSNPNSAGGHYYLAMNLGQLARTKSLGALKLVKEMEREFLRAIELDPKIDHGGPDRSLGQLYLDAPGWPTSIGNKSKARSHLQRAIEIAPYFPDNELALMDALVKWHDRLSLENEIAKYRRDVLPRAKSQFNGGDWTGAWADWDRSFQEIISKAQRMKPEGNRGTE